LYQNLAKQHELRANQNADRVLHLEQKLGDIRIEHQISTKRADFFEKQIIEAGRQY